MLRHPDFERKFSVRSMEQLGNPKQFALSKLVLPKGAILHYLPKDSVELGIEPKDLMLNGLETDIVVDHSENLVTNQGNPKDQSSQFRKLSRDYHKRYRRLRLLRKRSSGLRDENVVIVQNHALLQHLYIYRRTLLSTYDAWVNQQNVLWHSVSEYASESDRPQYLEVAFPEKLPTEAQFKANLKGIKRATHEVFTDELDLSLLELYLFLGDESKAGTGIDTIDPKALSQLNLIFQESGQWSLLPMKNLLDWKEEKGGEAAQKKFYDYLERMFENRTVSQNDTVEVAEVIETVSVNPEKSERAKAIMDQMGSLADEGLVSGAEYRRMEKLSGKYEEITNPVGEGTLSDLIKVDLEADVKLSEAKLKDTRAVKDKSMLQSSLLEMEKNYINNYLDKNIAQMVMALQNIGIAVVDYKKENVVDALTKMDIYTIKLVPAVGKPTTIRMRIPTLTEDGIFTTGGVRSKMATQRSDVPIRKTGPGRVALTSYFGKNFIDRSEKVIANLDKWVSSTLVSINEDSEHPLNSLIYASVYDNDFVTPRIYSAISKEFSGFKINGYAMNFDYRKREDLYGKDTLKALESKGHVVCGTGKGGFVTVDPSGVFYHNKDGNIAPLGDIAEFLGTPSRPPAEFTTITVLGKSIPVVMVLTFHLGIERMLRKLGAKYRVVPKGSRFTLAPTEIPVAFKNETLIVDATNPVTSLVIGGFRDYKRFIRSFEFNDFNHRDTVIAVLNRNQLGVRYSREIELMFKMFIDPITLGILTRRKEPTTFEGLLLEGTKMLTTDDHPEETDTEFMRFKGYERFAGMVYKQLMDSARKFRQAPPTVAQFDMNPKAVWMDILRDQSLMLVEDSNPIHNLKEKEMVTYAGQGGRSAQSMVKKTRMFHKNDVGVISEATVDSGKVAVNTYTSADPNFTSVYGETRKVEKTDGPATKVSTTALLHPYVDTDSVKRAVFASIQNSSVIGAKGYKTFPVRTGYESVLAQRVDAMYAVTAKSDGVVTEVTDKSMSIELSDGSTQGVEIGRVFGNVGGTSVPHMLVTDLTVGSTVEKGDVVAFNEAFFERDYFDPKMVSYKIGAIAKVALMEGTDTLEDSCAISQSIASEVESVVAKSKDIHVAFGQEIHNIVTVGDRVESESILCTIEDAVTSGGGLFDSDTIDTLSVLSAHAPKAGIDGVVERVEVIYHGDKKEMSPSLKAITDRADRERSKRVKRLQNGESPTGEVIDVVRIGKSKLEHDQALIRVYITADEGAKTGDKLIFGNALKTVIGRVMTGTNETLSGEEIQAIFGYHSIAARIVNSPERMGTLAALARVRSMKMAKIYREG